MANCNRLLQHILGGCGALTALGAAAAPVATPLPSPSPALSSGVSFKYDNTIPAKEVAQLQADLQYLASHEPIPGDANLLRTLGIAHSSSADLSNWLSERVHYVVNEDFDPSKNTTILKHGYVYQNAGILPDVLGDSPLGEIDADVVMLNVGGGIYSGGKFNTTNGAPDPVLVSENIPGIGAVPMTSPRVGIIQIGAGLFNVVADPATHTDDKMVSISHLATLFHEAHHSDGNGKSLGFPHSQCTTGIYAGKPGCDNNLNGPYLVGALVERTFTENCKDCTPADQEQLRVEYLDYFSRQLTSAPSEITQNQITVFQEEVEGCKAMAAQGISQPGECTAFTQLLGRLMDPKNFVPATVWDASPEGVL